MLPGVRPRKQTIIVRQSLFFYLVKNVPVIEMEAEQWRIIRECHEGTGNSVKAKAMSGHFGRDKTVALIQSKVYFPGFRQKTIEFIKSCMACQHVKCGGKFEKGGEKLKPIPVPRMPMRQIGIDCITNLPKTDEGYDAIVTAIDYTSKWPESKPLKGKFAEGVATRKFYNFE